LWHCLLRPLDIFCRPIHQPPWVYCFFLTGVYWLDVHNKMKWSFLHQPPHFVWVHSWTNSYAIRTLVYYMCIQWSWSMTSIFLLALKSLPSLYRNAPPDQGGVAQG
jgi:hypothetical protein